jgi:hypothetical protein
MKENHEKPLSDYWVSVTRFETRDLSKRVCEPFAPDVMPLSSRLHRHMTVIIVWDESVHLTASGAEA